MNTSFRQGGASQIVCMFFFFCIYATTQTFVNVPTPRLALHYFGNIAFFRLIDRQSVYSAQGTYNTFQGTNARTEHTQYRFTHTIKKHI